jgi:hypothetical protein
MIDSVIAAAAALSAITKQRRGKATEIYMKPTFSASPRHQDPSQHTAALLIND